MAFVEYFFARELVKEIKSFIKFKTTFKTDRITLVTTKIKSTQLNDFKVGKRDDIK